MTYLSYSNATIIANTLWNLLLPACHTATGNGHGMGMVCAIESDVARTTSSSSRQILRHRSLRNIKWPEGGWAYNFSD